MRNEHCASYLGDADINCHLGSCAYSLPVITLPLKEMSRTEKLMALEALWEDLSREDAFASPTWHAEALRETEQRVASGAETFVDWDIAKKNFGAQFE